MPNVMSVLRQRVCMKKYGVRRQSEEANSPGNLLLVPMNTMGKAGLLALPPKAVSALRSATALHIRRRFGCADARCKVPVRTAQRRNIRDARQRNYGVRWQSEAPTPLLSKFLHCNGLKKCPLAAATPLSECMAELRSPSMRDGCSVLWVSEQKVTCEVSEHCPSSANGANSYQGRQPQVRCSPRSSAESAGHFQSPRNG